MVNICADRELNLTAYQNYFGYICIIGQPLTLSRTPAGIAIMTPDAGEHTDEILLEAGYLASEIAAMHEKKVV